ncbi:hypothetical protein P171DRAFT_511977 [Karstenula rhodostoma CBS 690.94]|uniref:Uncharacterized protein n=1 Tax=Karstenula rhodostoma CBS 690.94 TaxID=1392251 RepID=A0A9P4UDD8_9PLEO|nr:hypothetical protein P171DRAFT_511977 [Karstenula rhodostoma CBS 690.94]
MRRPNFTECGDRYRSTNTLIEQYHYSGPVRLISPSPRTQITYHGCLALCGAGNEYYSWSIISATLTTWILPILGTLLQAPFESNAFWWTVKAINRWVDSPMSSMASILYHVEVSGKCALFSISRPATSRMRRLIPAVDMATNRLSRTSRANSVASATLSSS